MINFWIIKHIRFWNEKENKNQGKENGLKNLEDRILY